MPRTPDRTTAPAREVCAEPSDACAAPTPAEPPAPPAAARDLLRRALADARSPRVPDLSPYVPERPFPWSGPGLPWGQGDRPRSEAGDASGAGAGPTAPDPRTGAAPGSDGTIDLARWLRLSLAAPPGTSGRRRPVPSAGALHPVRAHLLIGPGCSLPPGRYAYDPRAHRAHPRGPAPDGVPPGALLVLTVTLSRTVAHYGHRAWPLLLLDAGHAAAALALAAPPAADVLVSLDADGALLAAAAGLPGAPDWPDAWPGTEPGLPLAAVRLTPPGASAAAPEPLSAWAALPLAASPTAPGPGAATAPPRELITAQRLLHQLAEAPGQPEGTWRPVRHPAGVTDGALETRRSAPPDDLRRPPGRDLLARILATARTTGPAGPDWTLAAGGDAPALYAAAPDEPGLHVRACGDARPALARWAAHQPWIGAAGAVLLAHGCPGDAPPAEVRRTHLAAGHAVGAAQAHATALGLRSRPIGSWQQADLGAALGDTPGRDWIVHGLALGAPPAAAPPPSASRTTAPLTAAGRLTGPAPATTSATPHPTRRGRTPMMLHPELLRAANTVRRPLALATALLAAVTLTHLAQAVLLALVLSRIARGETAALAPLLTAVLAVVLARAVLGRFQRLTAVTAGAAVRVRLRDTLLLRLGALGPTAVTGARAGAVRATLVDGVEGVDAYISRYLPQALLTCAVPPLLLVAVALVEPYAALALGLALLLALFGPRWWDRLLARRGKEHWDTYEALAADYLEALQGMPTLRAGGAVGRVRERLERRSAALHRSTVAKLRVSLVDTGLTDLAVQGGTAAAVLVACSSAATGRTAATGTYLLLLLASECFRPVRDLSREWHAGYLGVSAADGIAALRTAEPAVPDRGDKTAAWAGPPEIRFEDVRFTHPGSGRPALDGVSFTAAPGRTTAVVGPSGAGKSTLLSLLLRQRDPDGGRLTVAGTDAAAYSLASLRRGIAVVSQETYLFHATIAENLRIARPAATDEHLCAAARAAGIHEEIARLPDGYATLVGERGATLSGGQRQRLALARALLADAPVLILDEATSAVDERGQARIVRELSAAGRGRTCIVVAHRLDAVRHADHIVVLDAGRVAAAGDHATLLAGGGVYASLVAAGRTAQEERAA